MEENGFSFPSLPPPKALPKQASPHISSHSSPSNHLITCTGCAISTITPTVFHLCVFHSLAQNPLLQNATVIDRTATTTTDTAAMPSSSSPAQPQPQPQISAMPPPAPKTVTPAPLLAPNRKKVPFEKGYSQMDWVRLTQSGADLTGLGKGSRPRKDITMQEVKLHKTLEDGWTVLRGKVYNLTPYIKFHPGGATILKGILGKDGTVLFNKYHAWVNAEFLLAKCLVGTLAVEDAGAAASIDA